MTSEDLISPEMFLVGGECFTPIFEEEVKMSMEMADMAEMKAMVEMANMAEES